MNEFQKKIITRKQLPGLGEHRAEPLIWTNGCFDLIHSGHIRYLYDCKKLGGQLIVGVNSDDSVRRLKGPRRPLIPLQERMEHLASFFFVDYVVSFDEDTPLNSIKILRPDFLVKGGDYEIRDIVGYEEVISFGGKVMTIPLTEGRSTSALINKILERYDED